MTRRNNINPVVFHAEEIIDALTRSPMEGAALTVGQGGVGDVAASVYQTLNAREMASLYALLAYTAHEQQVLQETVQAIVEAQFGVRHISGIKASDFDRAVSFIADLHVDQRIN